MAGLDPATQGRCMSANKILTQSNEETKTNSRNFVSSCETSSYTTGQMPLGGRVKPGHDEIYITVTP
ncbi:MAG: hypothetical protein ABL996_16335 [Micropepsaceae bacterium]